MRNKKLYNYIVNTFGLSKENILKHVESRLEDIISKHVMSILNSNRVERMIVNRICDYMKTGKADYWSSDKNFEKIVDGQIKKIIEEYLSERCRVTFQFSNNSIRFMEDK